MMKRTLIRLLLLTLPAMLLVAFLLNCAIRYLRVSQGVTIHPLVALTIFVLTLAAVIRLTFGDILREMRRKIAQAKANAREH